MKKYIALAIGIVVLVGAIGGYMYFKKPKVVTPVQQESAIRMTPFDGEVSRFFEGTSTLAYSMDIPDTATTTTEMTGAFVKVTYKDAPYVTMYISYEGGRGYTAKDYVDAIIAPHVSVINLTDVSKIGAYDWQGAETEGSEWHIASANNGNWLVIIENKKAIHDLAQKTIESFKVKENR